ncbi:DUF2922 domain-containing protein [Paraclostridium sordellii]|uniref:DUF2922 domain-containing protein n=1 Tax=Paraclostridium sordellii TaxID=1505 RepID=UPI0005DD9591|nr:DUF2922 domain-containing protein [Paeniclostridium sordellii]CEP97192.1 Protein of uncharacterised function (DUF2922) [[Clostridium] sordellii] [Paeniclostridium sordellii]CEQ00881.1 Protein of uncharacterised function (DUF2922) [[Clostridium] sordellii] [Paeniclostridium sordellii]
MKTAKKLLMTFTTKIGRKISISIDDPKDDITEAQIKECMDLIVSKNIFAPYGSEIESAQEAKIVVTDTSEYDLVV